MEIFGWPQEKENILLSTILTGDRALLISQPGAAKTLLPAKISRALGVTFAPFDLNAVSFDDILGVINIPEMQNGKMEYMKTPGTIWGKEFVVYEELNRCKPGIQGKILEHLRSGTIGGIDTGTRWCWANMNPVGHAGANKLMPATIDRFSSFVWAPDALDMTMEDRASISRSMSSADAPALSKWLDEKVARSIDTTDYVAAGKMLRSVLMSSGKYWTQLSTEIKNLDKFLAMFADLLFNNMSEAKDDKSPDPVRISGRRLAFLRRSILSYRAVELGLDATLNVYPTNFRASLQRAINASIPVGINEEAAPHEAMRTFINLAIRQAYDILEAGDSKEVALQYQLFCSRDPLERAKILLSGDIKSEEVINSGWQRITSMNDRGADMLAFVAVNLDAKMRANGKDGILPTNVLDVLKGRIKERHVKPELPKLPGQLVPYFTEINSLIEKSTMEDPLMGLIAIETTHEFISTEPDGNFTRLDRRIRDKQDDYRALMAQAVK